MSTVISLCDITGTFVVPWVEAGHNAILVDPQHGTTRREGRVLKIAETVESGMPWLADALADGDVAFVAGFPPCTDISVSGARWFEAKRAVDPMFQAKAVAVAEQCRTIGAISGAPYFVENPVSVLSRVFGSADHHFHPWHFSGIEPADNYRKRTNLWTGNGFVMPDAVIDAWLGEPDDRIHKAAPGPERANFRSATPMGFARAVFEANKSATRSAAA